MITELFIESYPVDMTDDISTMLTFQLDDVRDFGSRNTTFSKTIVLPGTQNNNKLLGHIFEFGGANPFDSALPNVLANFNAAKSARALIFQNHIQVFKGVLRLLEIVIDGGRKEYEVAVFGELGGLISDLSNAKLEDLDFSAYNQLWNAANIAASWDNPGGSGVYFPHIDYGTYSTDKHNWDFHTFRPALYVKEYIDKMLSDAGYTYDCDLFSTSRFKSLVIPHNQQKLRGESSRVVTAATTAAHTMIDNFDGDTADSVPWDSRLAGAFSYTGGVFTYTDAATLNTTISILLNGTRQSDTPGSFTISIRKNGTALASQTFTTPGSNLNIPYSYITSVATTFVTGDTVDIYYTYATGTKVIVTLDSPSTLNVDTDTPAFAPIAYGQNITMNDGIPKNILQKDFLASIIKLFNLYIWEDKFDNRKLIIAPYVDFYNTDPATFLDWTYKVNRARPMKLKPMSELNSRYYEFTFKADSDYYSEQYRKRYNEGYGDYRFDSEFEFVSESQSVDLIFSSAVLIGYAGEDKVYPTIMKRTGTTTIVEENIDSNIRILQTKKVTGVNSWDMKSGTTVLGSYTVYGYAGHLDDPDAPSNDLHFGSPKELFFTLASGALNVNQFNVYWSPYMAEITNKDSKLLTASFRITPRDIYELDFSRLIYIDGSLWRLSQISDYNGTREDECMATLLKVIELLY